MNMYINALCFDWFIDYQNINVRSFPKRNINDDITVCLNPWQITCRLPIILICIIKIVFWMMDIVWWMMCTNTVDSETHKMWNRKTNFRLLVMILNSSIVQILLLKCRLPFHSFMVLTVYKQFKRTRRIC